jgi:hypothetical protein
MLVKVYILIYWFMALFSHVHSTSVSGESISSVFRMSSVLIEATGSIKPLVATKQDIVTEILI